MYQISKPVSKLKQLFATVLFDSTLASATVGVRGVADCQQIVFRAADVDVHCGSAEALESFWVRCFAGKPDISWKEFR